MPIELKYNSCQSIFLINPDFSWNSRLYEVGRKVSCRRILIGSR